MPIQRHMERRLREIAEMSDKSAAVAFDRLQDALGEAFVHPARTASEIAAAAAINGCDATAQRLRIEPEYFGSLKDPNTRELAPAMAALGSFDRAIKAYWQARDELEIYRSDRDQDRDR